jgi:hypothetical protein
MQPAVSWRGIVATAIKPYRVIGENLDIQGQVSLSFWEGKRSNTFLVYPLPTQGYGLFGANFLGKVGAIINLYLRELSLSGSNKAPHERAYGFQDTPSSVFPKVKLEADKSLQTRRDEASPRGHKLDNPPCGQVHTEQQVAARQSVTRGSHCAETSTRVYVQV